MTKPTPALAMSTPKLVSALLILSLSASATLAITNNRNWSATAATGDWNTAGNWSEGIVPNSAANIAIFATSGTTNVTVSATTTLSAITYNSGASAFTTTASPAITLTLSGTGISNSSGKTQNFVTTDNGGSGNVGQISFTNGATAGSLTAFTNNGGTVSGANGGITSFYNTASADHGSYINNGGTAGGAWNGFTNFYNTATAGNGIFTNNGGTVYQTNGGKVQFNDGSSAGAASFTSYGGTVAGAYGASVTFSTTSNAGTATFTNNGGTGAGADGAALWFFNSSSASSATITNNGSTVNATEGGVTLFYDSSTAGNSTLIANGGSNNGKGGEIVFRNASTAGTAKIQIYGNGHLDISGHNPTGISISSVEGSGNIFLGARNLTLGGNNLSTTLSGVIQDGGNWGGIGGSFTKVGTGTLTLSGANTYTGVTTISAGTVLANNSTGSAFGSGAVTVASGATLGGSGSIAGLTTISSGGHLAPGNSPGTLTFANGLTLASGSVLDFEIGTSSDLIKITGGTFTGPGGIKDITVNIFDSGGFAPGVPYTLIDFSGASVSGFTLADLKAGTLIGTTVETDYSLSLTGGILTLTYNGSASAVPEPSTYAAILGIAAFGCAVIRRKRRAA